MGDPRPSRASKSYLVERPRRAWTRPGRRLCLTGIARARTCDPIRKSAGPACCRSAASGTSVLGFGAATLRGGTGLLWPPCLLLARRADGVEISDSARRVQPVAQRTGHSVGRFHGCSIGPALTTATTSTCTRWAGTGQGNERCSPRIRRGCVGDGTPSVRAALCRVVRSGRV